MLRKALFRRQYVSYGASSEKCHVYINPLSYFWTYIDRKTFSPNFWTQFASTYFSDTIIFKFDAHLGLFLKGILRNWQLNFVLFSVKEERHKSGLYLSWGSKKKEIIKHCNKKVQLIFLDGNNNLRIPLLLCRKSIHFVRYTRNVVDDFPTTLLTLSK